MCCIKEQTKHAHMQSTQVRIKHKDCSYIWHKSIYYIYIFVDCEHIWGDGCQWGDGYQQECMHRTGSRLTSSVSSSGFNTRKDLHLSHARRVNSTVTAPESIEVSGRRENRPFSFLLIELSMVCGSRLLRGPSVSVRHLISHMAARSFPVATHLRGRPHFHDVIRRTENHGIKRSYDSAWGSLCLRTTAKKPKRKTQRMQNAIDWGIDFLVFISWNLRVKSR